jgi:hypothetical protein
MDSTNAEGSGNIIKRITFVIDNESDQSSDEYLCTLVFAYELTNIRQDHIFVSVIGQLINACNFEEAEKKGVDAGKCEEDISVGLTLNGEDARIVFIGVRNVERVRGMIVSDYGVYDGEISRYYLEMRSMEDVVKFKDGEAVLCVCCSLNDEDGDDHKLLPSFRQ